MRLCGGREPPGKLPEDVSGFSGAGLSLWRCETQEILYFGLGQEAIDLLNTGFAFTPLRVRIIQHREEVRAI